MPVFSPQQEALTLDLLLGRIPVEQFCRQFPVDAASAPTLVEQSLRAALSQRDGAGVELGLGLGFHFGFSPACAPTLLALAEEPWHQRHEDVIRALDGMRLPNAVEVLRRAATTKHEYLEYSDASPLGVKCVWALAHIGTPAAIAALGTLLSCGDPTVATSAGKRLRNAEREHPDASVRSAARAALAESAP